MKKTITTVNSLLVAAGLFILTSCSNDKPGGYGHSGGDSCVAPASWFPHSQTPAPEEGANSPFADVNTTSNCDFHQWAWQKFLYLTRTAANGKLNFENLVQINNGMDTLGSTLILDDTTQAGSRVALYDKTNHPIYYAIYTNREMYDFSKKNINLFATCMSGDTLNPALMAAKGYDTLSFPVGAFEMKTAWIPVTSLDQADTANYYITQGRYIHSTKTARMALIGMHIIGKVINHPELIWATYEHTNLAPVAHWPANAGPDTEADSTQVLSGQDMLFYTANATMKAMDIRRRSVDPTVYWSTYHLYDHGTQPAYTGMILGAKDSSNLANINMLNQSVLSKLSTEQGPWKNYEYMGAVWIDPTVSKLQPGDGNIGALNRQNLRGSRANSNITMETYTQLNWTSPNPNPPPVETGLTTPDNTMNCFGCHATVSFSPAYGGVNGANFNLALSHVFNNGLDSLIARTKHIQLKPTPENVSKLHKK